MIRESTAMLSLILGLLCYQFTVGESGTLPNPGNKDRTKPESLNMESEADIETPEFIFKTFSNILESRLQSDKTVIRLFSNPMDIDLAVNIASSIVDSLALEVGLNDSYAAEGLIIEALLSVNNTARPEEYCKVLTSVLGKMLLDYKILNSENYFTLADVVGQIILNSTLDLVNGRKGFETVGSNAGIKTGLNAVDTNINTAAGRDIRADNAKINVGLGDNIVENILGSGIDNVNLGLTSSTGFGTKTNLNSNTDAGLDANMDSPLGTDFNSSDGSGINIDLSVSEEAIFKFKSELINELLKDRNFKSIFSDYIPRNVLRQIAASVCLYISKAFAISRSFLLPLESSFGNLPLDSRPSPEQYANIVTNMLTNLFTKVKFITKGTASLQATIAANAITSGISSFIRISSIPGSEFSIKENSFNSYFSILNGLQKLPYVGIEASSPNLPPALKLTYASAYASRFAKTLVFKLVSSNNFLELFSVNAPRFNNRIIVKSLANSMAEAFGLPNPNLFYDLYFKALLTSAVNFNSMNYAKALSFATARALFLNGYFLAGNVNIQAEIAKNAIIRALSTKLRLVSTQVALFPNVLRLPLVTQLKGVSPSQLLLNQGTGIGLKVGVGSGVGLGLDKSIDAKINAASGAGVNVNSGVGIGANLNNGLFTADGVNVGLGTTGLGVNAGLGTGLGGNAGLGIGLHTNTALGVGLDSNTLSGARLSANAGLGDLGMSAGLGTILGANSVLGGGKGGIDGLKLGLGAKAALGTGLRVNDGLEAGLGVNAGLVTQLGTNAGLGAGSGANADLGAGLGANAGLVSQLSVNTGLGAELGANADLGAQLGAGLGANGGSGAQLGVNSGLRAGLGDISGLEARFGANAGLGAGLGENVLLGAGSGYNSVLGAGLGANAGLGARLGENVRLGAGLGNNAVLGAGLGANADFGAQFGINDRLGAGLGANADFGAQFGINERLGAGLGANAGLEAGLGVNSGLGAGLRSNTGLGAGLEANAGSSVGLGDIFGANAGLRTELDVNTALGVGAESALAGLDTDMKEGIGSDLDVRAVRFSRKKRSTDDSAARINPRFETDLNESTIGGLKVGSLFGTRADLEKGSGTRTRASLSGNEFRNTNLDIDGNLDAGARTNVGVNLGKSIVKEDNSNTQLSIVDVLPLILANKLYQSTAFYTSVLMAGDRKVINLISQALATEFSLPIAVIFLRSYEQCINNYADNSFEINVVGLAKATTNALVSTGLLDSNFSASMASQLANAVVSKFSSLITTSLELKEDTMRPRWTYLLKQDFIQPPLIPGINVFK